ncbi:MAG: 30S ribosomal protein S2 [Candidatus Yanofskybacteria bacterium RIFCSPHIGHO2_02_FULL_41_29]|uniref:Small ribosomal subunit protein uS2 n=1 Tax=Candidatus Yanofskybacteria bacterium RIFCSPHIGHO2_01_FULL_41_53 TaxID=1802663 RepID=A0A1F8EF15_9BACT|nr:MAG: 30S ribosomal protein S2 [Candidatus Yanofskybacteria bacterium RIFCSPHIGHO2_01_FULL_41_53]OGN11374.1 MAG: 30S ribosomal protein S2 [Candidatus Yanofskybacteria bacterium RIFCSPHIGHO2_02_FULL_41_29]OGN17744.1 MAG: 30S ribosomal protein S2 [Candidatus Yanofskybacteria bacterium RIFCSPHIGHO2_12_FULL_41_9]OGN24744.1 MAG: 30S ribosomal protein S2 [Candidatus Yanofskybacteria bacterium RIFCSPLOWO2_01_FULL_41_67]OGN28941.1 MAG: 30S ribosomal protein S2 [Candidatus Yanofskybacteria bacterium R
MSDLNTQLNYEEMLKSGMHFGRKKTVFNPKMKKYVFTVKEGICIIDLIKTQAELSSATEHLKRIIAQNGIILFVALTKQSVDSVKDLAVSLGMPYVVDRWLGGTLTNFKVISNRVKKLEEMENARKSGGLEKYTKKERLMFEREILKMEKSFSGLRKLTRLPDVVFISSLKDGALPAHEAKIVKIPIIAIANTDSDPAEVAYIIPANDRSKKSVDLIIEALKKELTAK